MDRLEVPYYAGLLTAARYHGAAHQQPQIFQVVVPKNRPPIHCGLVKIRSLGTGRESRSPDTLVAQ